MLVRSLHKRPGVCAATTVLAAVHGGVVTVRFRRTVVYVGFPFARTIGGSVLHRPYEYGLTATTVVVPPLGQYDRSLAGARAAHDPVPGSHVS